MQDVQLLVEDGEVHVRLEPESTAWPCPLCAATSPGYDARERRWRHLDTCQYRTIVIAAVPRVQCPTHGVVQIAVPWAEEGARFTALFEALVIDWLHDASLTAVSRRLHLSWDEVDGIMQRAVTRGLARRPAVQPRRIGVDETAFQKHHEYVTVVSDLDDARVLYIADDRREASLTAFYAGLGPTGCARLEVIAMDMWGAYISATHRVVPEADRKIVFDKFHVARLLGRAVDAVRRTEQRALQAQGVTTLTGTKYWWLTRADQMDAARWHQFTPLRESTLKTARAWALKEVAMQCWHYVRRGWARKAWRAWLAWAVRSRLRPMRVVAETIRKYLDGILNAIVTGATNARAEGLNSQIQALKRRACGFRNRNRFRHAIYFHLGGLDLYPACLTTTHTKP